MSKQQYRAGESADRYIFKACPKNKGDQMAVAKIYRRVCDTVEETDAFLRRVVACLNACEGISTEELEQRSKP